MADLQGLAQLLPSRGTLVTPQAPHSGRPWGYGAGWAWYRYLGQDRAEAESLAESLKAVELFLERLPESLGFRPGPVVLGGFSQGGTTSLAYGLSHPGSVAGVVVLSGFLANQESLVAGAAALSETPVFWAHGTQDPSVPFSSAIEGRNRIRKAGGSIHARDYDMGHWVSPEEMSDLRDWLEQSIPGWED
ncbi:MAG: alpha/beta fold hydrolase [Longimicrobiales bacterium]|nr:alpha/beta fold hydrolase [Longimicrobiales bacterium]